MAALAAVVLSAAMVMVVVVQAATTGSSKMESIVEPTEAAADLVAEACKNMSNGLLKTKDPHFDEEPCVSVLRSDNRSAVAKDHGDLVMIALDLLDRRINELAAKIDGILRSLPVHNRTTEHAFQLCKSDYASLGRAVPVCRDMFLKLKPLGKKVKQFDAMAALGCLDKIGITAWDCDWWLSNDRDYEKSDESDEFYDMIRHVRLPWGLMVLATGCANDDSNW